MRFFEQVVKPKKGLSIRVRLIAAVVVVVAALSAALYVHQRRVSTGTEFFQDANAQPTLGLPNLYLSGSSPSTTKRPSWEDPVAVALVVAGLGSAAGIVTVRRQAA